MSPYKAPVLDGCQAFFYQKHWRQVGESVVELVANAFRAKRFNEGLGPTFVCLIPKEANPDSIRKFRPIALCNVVYKCSTPRVLWNGEPLNPLTPTCGLRQGDPLSPYLFVLCVERLGYLIEQEVDEGVWEPLAVSRGGPRFSHLFFADDFIFLARATQRSTAAIVSIIEKFCSSSGLVINKEKSKVFFSRNTNRGLRRILASQLGIGCTMDLGKYLGVPLVHNRASPGLYNELIDRVQSQLSSWKAKMLNLAGQAILIQSVTTAMPSYIMQSSWFPTSICDWLDKLNRSFL
ncbi:hypothetical protein BUALT_Bualt15G0117900 [Buddleja alternifolia]|uniref:Reverse transcriptase domain-containing protein n=1 Tax=Buddleja alternifolia TaxID=168488 RepID=A0AAV6WL24_9LAMI|nr:hypothetical protein BUALT_Bualt15G0117900 [Buddleja alternifolia]